MHSNFKQLSIIVASFVLVGCGGGGVSNDTESPIIKSTSSYTTPENKKYISFVSATDASEISYSISAGLDKDKFSIDSYEGTLIFKTFPDYENPDDFDGDNIYELVVKVTDSSNNMTEQNITVTLNDIDENIPKSFEVKPLLNGTNNYTVNGTKDLYILFSNHDSSNSSSPSVTHNAKVAKVVQAKATGFIGAIKKPVITRTTKDLQDFKSNMNSLFSKNIEPQAKTIAVPQRMEDVVGQSKSFYLDSNGYDTTTATARKVVSNVLTNSGSKTLNIWVSDDSFGSGCGKSKCVTQTMVDVLANTFLKTSSDNDIYDWVTNIYGEEWGTNVNGFTGLIPSNDEITILLTDISNDDSPTGGIIGFFHPKDNFSTGNTSGSNERIMFYIDAVMFANNEGTIWELNDFWPKEIVATLAHEFQHMIHFYQKTILLTPNGENTDTWINEMLSESTEDLIATKIQHIGPRGVDYTDGSAGSANNEKGRYPLFNANNTLSLTAWNNNLSDYAKVNAFGAYLLRNYGGAKVLHDIMHNAYVDEQAVLDAVHKSAEGSGKTFANLLSEWGTSVLLSDKTDAQRNKYSYNTNDFTVSEESRTIYKMGAINFFNYNPKPTISTTIGSVKAQGNYYYKVGDNLTGTITIDLNLNGQTKATLIAK